MRIAAPVLLLAAAHAGVTAQVSENLSGPMMSGLGKVPLHDLQRTQLEEAVKRRDYKSAETLLVKEIERNPKSSELLTVLGGIFFLDGRYLNAAVALKKAEALGPLDDQTRFTLAMSYITLDHRDWARPELEKLSHNDPKNAVYSYWLARLDYDAQQFAAAAEKLQKVIEIAPNFVKAYDNLGLCFEAMGRLDEAIQTYREAVLLNRQTHPNSPWPPLNSGKILLKLGKLEEAEGYLRESLRYDPKFPEAHYQLGVLLEKQKKDSEAVAELNRAAILDPSYPEPAYALARIYRRSGDEQNAQKALSAFQKLKKDNPPKRPH